MKEQENEESGIHGQFDTSQADAKEKTVVNTTERSSATYDRNVEKKQAKA